MKLSRDALFLIAGAGGLAAAALGAIGAPRVDALGIGAAATVDGRPISREAADRAVQALSNDKRNPVTVADETAALERLIEEELLVQRGISLGLAETDLAARKAIVQSVLQLALAERAGETPSEGELKDFYAQNAGMFAPAGRIRARLVYVKRDARAASRFAAVKAALAAGRTTAGLGDAQAIVLPNTPLSPNELRTYVGAALATQATRARGGQVIVAEEADGWRLLRIEATSPPAAPRYEDVAGEVRAEWDRRADEAAVRAYVERLKRRARITRAA